MKKTQKIDFEKVASNHKHSKFQLQQKLTQEFIRLGYEKEQINRILETLSYSDEDTLEREFQSLYNKLARKYQGKELQMHLKNKLYQKGFSLSAIQEQIEKWNKKRYVNISFLFEFTYNTVINFFNFGIINF